jgi:hypothetical protein
MLNILKETLIGKFIDFLLSTPLGLTISSFIFVFIGSLFSSNSFINLFVNKQYLEFFSILGLGFLFFVITNLTIFLITNYIKNHYIKKEKKITEAKNIKDKKIIDDNKYNETKMLKYKINFNIKKENVRHKITLKDHFNISDIIDVFFIPYTKKECNVILNTIYKPDNSFIEIIFKPILINLDNLEKLISLRLKVLSHESVKENLLSKFRDYPNFRDEVMSCIDEFLTESEDTMLDIVSAGVREKIKQDLLDQYTNSLKETKKNEINTNIDLELFSDRSEFVINFYFNNIIVETKHIALKTFLLDEETGLYFEKLVYLRDYK